MNRVLLYILCILEVDTQVSGEAHFEVLAARQEEHEEAEMNVHKERQGARDIAVRAKQAMATYSCGAFSHQLCINLKDVSVGFYSAVHTTNV